MAYIAVFFKCCQFDRCRWDGDNHGGIMVDIADDDLFVRSTFVRCKWKGQHNRSEEPDDKSGKTHAWYGGSDKFACRPH